MKRPDSQRLSPATAATPAETGATSRNLELFARALFARATPEFQETYDDDALRAIRLFTNKIAEACIEGRQLATETDFGAAAPAAEATKDSAVASQSIRVGVDVLENLMTMVSELVLTRNQLLQIMRSQKDTDFASPLQRLNHVTSELQEGVMKTRMQPVGNAWAKLPRLVRDLSHELNKKIDLQMLGAETELDRQVLELIKDPLTHLVRNCADHGLEVPADRKAAGKSETGRITLNAFHEGGHIVIEISDDGKGLPLDKIRAKAVANKLATEAEMASMPDQQVMQFIFKAGFSTAAQVTSVSGRGVGMDVVRTNIEKIGGTVDLKSQLGKGTAFVIKIPLTLAIVSALIVEASGERFAIPQISVLELVRTGPGSESRIEHINEAPFLRLRNRILPLVSLHGLLRLDDSRKATQAENFIVVTQVDVTPPNKDNATNALEQLADQSRKHTGNLRFDVWRQDSRPNHFTVVESWNSRGAFDVHGVQAQTVEFRNKLATMTGALYDERLYQPVE